MQAYIFCGKYSSFWGFFALLWLLHGTLVAQPAWSWAEGGVGGSDQRGFAICTDVNGYSYSTGYFKGTVDFDGNTLVTSGNEDMYITKYDPSGNGQWAVQIDGVGDERGMGITTDNAGNVYVCGRIQGTCTFYGSPNVVLTAYGGHDIFIAKFNPSGQVLWAKRAGSNGNDEAAAICTDDNNVYVTGMFNGTASFGALSQLTSSGGEDVFVASYSCSNGTEQWAVKGGSTATDRGEGIAVDASGVYAGGRYDAAITFQNHTGSLASIGASDAFLVKYNLSGTTGLWKRRAGSNNTDQGTCVTLHGNNVYLGGFFENTMNIYNTGPSVATLTAANNKDGFIIQYNATTGNYNWVISENGQGDDRIMAISADANGSVYTTGYWNGTLPFGPGPAVSSANRDVFVTAYSPAGTFLQGMRATGSAEEEGYGVSATYAGAVYVTGYYKSNNTTFGSTAPFNASGDDIFIAKILCGVAVANAGINQTVCASTVTLGGNTPSAGAGQWTLISGAGTITTPSSPSSTVTGLGAGTNVFRWTITNGSCESYDEVTITRDLPPTTAAAGNNQTICSSSALLNANNPSTGTGLWSLIAGSGTIVSPANGNSSITGLTPGANIFQWTITNGVCPSSSDQVTINVDAMPATADAGSDQVICSSSTSLAGNVPSIGTGTWTVINGNGNIVTPSSATSLVNSLSAGQNEFVWTITNGTCPSSRDTVVIQRDASPTTASAGNDQTICSSSAYLNGNSAWTGNGVWTLISGSGTIATPANDNTWVNGLGVGANVFQWTITNGVCPSSSDQVTINVDAMPTAASAGPDQTICDSVALLSGNTPAVGIGVWTVATGGGNITNPGSPSSGVDGLQPGPHSFTWIITNGVCPSSEDTVLIDVDADPTPASAGSDQTLCAGTALLNANNPSAGTGLWTLVSGSGTIASPSNDNTSVSGLGVGANVFQWTTSNGVCPSSSDQVVINVDANPTPANAGSDQIFCSSSATLNGNTPLVGTGTWSVVVGTGTIVNPVLPASAVTGLPVGMSIFQWEISNGVCPSSSDLVVMTVDPMPTIANAGPDHPRCATNDTLSGNIPLTGTGTWTLISGSGTIANPNSPTSAVSALGVGANVFEWSISNGTCPASVDQVVITRDDFPSAAVAGADENSCASDDTLNGNVPLAGNGTWSVTQGSATLLNPAAPACGVNGLSVGVNEFVWTISSGSCPVQTDTVQIVYNEMPSAASAGTDILACEEQLSMQAQAPAVGAGMWSPLNGSPAVNDPADPLTALPLLGAGTWQYVWTTQNGFCVSTPDTVSITVFSPPDIAIAGDDQVTYSASVTLSANPIDTGAGTWSVVQGSATFEDIHDPFTRVTGLSPGLNILRWTSSNGVCPESSDDMRIEVMQLVIPSGYSPNGDGVNDNFEITGLHDYENPSLEVFNRWGNAVFVSQHYTNNWNGTGSNGETLPDDVYYYVLKADPETVFTGYIVIKRSTQ